MALEIERNFYIFDINEIRKKFKKLKAKKKINLFKVYNDYLHKDKNKYTTIRLRDEGDKKTFTIKQKDKKDRYDTEWEIDISDIEIAKEMIEIIGFKFDSESYLEKIREAYYYKKSEIAIDYVPGLFSFLQIESPTEKELLLISKELNLSLDEEPQNPFKLYGINKKKYFKIEQSFRKIDEMKRLVTKQKTKYNEMIKNQKKLYKETIHSNPTAK
tara:strand:+ start:188 stop:832 length:645 start_codon:yes stop_codon:yes gene_type:complete